eukprot:4121096-Amphidinium_carterae.1
MAEALASLTSATQAKGKGKSAAKLTDQHLVENLARLVLTHERKLAELDSALALEISVKSSEGKAAVLAVRKSWDVAFGSKSKGDQNGPSKRAATHAAFTDLLTKEQGFPQALAADLQGAHAFATPILNAAVARLTPRFPQPKDGFHWRFQALFSSSPEGRSLHNLWSCLLYTSPSPRDRG